MEESPETLYDPIRKKWVAFSPEERVRQQTLRWLVEQGGYNPAHLLVERTLPVPQTKSRRRLDIAYVESHSLLHSWNILLLIECKAHFQSAAELEQAKRQVLGYAWHLPATALALVSDNKACYCFMDNPTWYEGLPHLQQLLPNPLQETL